MICGVPTLLRAYLHTHLYISLLRNPQRGGGVTSRFIPNWYVPVGLMLESVGLMLDAGHHNLEGTYGRGCGRAASQELGPPARGCGDECAHHTTYQIGMSLLVVTS